MPSCGKRREPPGRRRRCSSATPRTARSDFAAFTANKVQRDAVQADPL